KSRSASTSRNFDQQKHTKRSTKNTSNKRNNKTQCKKKLKNLDLENK
ncbi:29346_t:CDS:1, partial [Gigaspora margarita]